jgi:hypothetical protein
VKGAPRSLRLAQACREGYGDLDTRLSRMALGSEGWRDEFALAWEWVRRGEEAGDRLRATIGSRQYC